MPIYEYRCESCEHRLEKLQKMSEGDLVDCPECNNPSLKRLVSAPSFRLSGSGWYETDFKKDNKRNLADSGDKSETTGASSEKAATGGEKSTSKDTADSSSKPEKKPAAKTTSKESK